MDVVSINGEKHVNDEELLQAHAHVWNHLFNFINSMSLKCAIDLGIPDIIHNHSKPMIVTELVAALPIDATKACNIYRLMHILVHAGFFAQQKLGENDQKEGYALTPFVTAHGRTFCGYCGNHPMLSHLFNEGMASDARLVSSILIRKCKGVFEGPNSLMDVGGGTGNKAKAISDAFPNLDCTVFNLRQVVDGLQGSGNLKYVGGDMLEAVPEADAVLLKWILHDWNDQECVMILKHSKEAISSRGEGGKVIVIHMVLMEKKQQVNEASIEWASLFLAAGFSDYKITPILGLRSLNEVYP